ncbi:MAG: AI-2E family transporter [Bacteroidales bacterium]|nr:AI-2E family transporter [Bacteroidales bacterium]
MPKRQEITFDRFIRAVAWIAGFFGAFFLLKKLSGVLLPFFIAWLIAYFIYPIVKFCQYKLRFRNRMVAIITTLTLLTLLIGIISYFLVPPLIIEFIKVKELIALYIMGGADSASNVPHTITDFIQQNVDLNTVMNVLSQESFAEIIKTALPKLWTILSESVSFVFNLFTLFIILLYVIFILLDYETLASGWIHLLPKKYRPATLGIVEDIQYGMNRYFRGQALIASLVGVMFCIGFLIIDFPLAIGLGLFLGALNMVPYLQLVGFIPTILLALLKAANTGENFWIIMGLALIVFIVVQVIQDAILTPRIMGKITGLNPAIILLSLSIWGSLLGILGMIIALPTTTLLLSYYQRFIINKEKLFKTEKTTYESDD